MAGAMRRSRDGPTRADRPPRYSGNSGRACATTGFPQHWQHARTCRVSDQPPPLPQPRGALQVWVDLVGPSPLPVPKEKEEGATRGRPDADVSEQPTFREAHHCVRGDHQVIEHPNVDQQQRGLQRLRQILVGTAGIRGAGGVLGCIRRCQHHCLFRLVAWTLSSARAALASFRGE